MIRFLKTHKLSHSIALIIVIFGMMLRFIGYAQFPVLGETKDEFAWTFLGSSLLETGIPSSWSHFSAYVPFTTLTIGYDQFPMVKPALDHPPLFSLIPGIMHVITSDNWMSVPSIKAIRFPMILLGGVNIGLVYLVAMELFEKKSKALLATLFYATIPAVVFSSRLVVAENLLVTWTLVSVLLISVNNKTWKYISFILIGVVSILTKFSGIVIPLTILLYGFLSKDSDLKTAGIIGTVVGIALFMVYGWWFDWHVFVQVFFSQSGRDIGLATLVNRFFLHPTIVSHVFLDGWVFVGILSLAHFLSCSKENMGHNQTLQFIKVSVLLQLAFIATAVGETTFHGWYAYMLFPFIVFAVVELIEDRQKFIWIFPFAWMFFLPTIRTGLLYSVGLPTILAMRVIAGIGFLPLLATILKQEKIVQKYLFIGILGLVLFANIATVLHISDSKYWQDDEYFLPSRVVK